MHPRQLEYDQTTKGRYADRGLVRVSVWVPATDKEDVKAYARWLRSNPRP